MMPTHLIFMFVIATDINECEIDLDICSNSSNRVCEDTPGSYMCVCEEGFQEDTDGKCVGKAMAYTRISSRYT